ncbi:phage tail protein [Paenibacillus thailandensis]|uniref:Phage tail protein n=1 Tax=Paenibacillus thailandensis TaxID=393250 RepID=A0ABW5QT25_9BACL
MLNVSPEFKTAVYAPTRTTRARVSFNISDVTAPGDAAVTVTSEVAGFSRLQETKDSILTRPAYATFEPDYWKLDGSFVLPPKPSETDYEVGWYSDAFSNADGSFSVPQVLDYTFGQTHSSIGITVTFDTPTGECATDFVINVYNGGTVIYTDTVTGNTLAQYVLEKQLNDYNRVTVSISKWSAGNRRAKVIEVTFGVVRVYEDNKLIRVDVTEEIDPTSAALPVSEMKFVVDNSSREFNILNPTGSYAYLAERQRVHTEIGVMIAPNRFEYLTLGYYYLSDWQSDEGALTTTFTARNLIDFLSDEEITNLTSGSMSLYDFTAALLTGAGVERYEIDPALSSITTQGVYDSLTRREILQMIALAGMSVVRVDRYDKLIIEQLPAGASVDTLDFDNIYKEPKINLEELVTRVEVNYYSGVDVAGVAVATVAVAGGKTLKVENTLISSQAHAQAVANWFLAENLKRAIYEINWRQNPALECGDLVEVENSYNETKQSRITRQEYNYAGFLRGRSLTRGAI